jgi:hypothetical protein
MSSEESDSEGSGESYSTIKQAIAAMAHTLEELYGEAEELEESLHDLHVPITDLQLAQLGDVPFLQTSPFRTAPFLVKKEGIPGAAPGHRYPFHMICAALRDHLFKTGAVAADGTITLTADLQELFEVQESTIQWIPLVGKLRAVLR